MLEAICDAREWSLLGMGPAGTTKKRWVLALWDAVPQNHHKTVGDISLYRSPHQNWLPSGVIKHGLLEHVPFRSMVFHFSHQKHAIFTLGVSQLHRTSQRGRNWQPKKCSWPKEPLPCWSSACRTCAASQAIPTIWLKEWTRNIFPNCSQVLPLHIFIS